MDHSSDRSSPRPERPRLYLVALSHLDTQWRWTLRDTIGRFLPRTVTENERLFERYPRWTLSFEGAIRYRHLAEHHPELFAIVRRRVDEGRWRPVGAAIEAFDALVPSPESILRQILYGQRWFERELGRDSQDLFLPDCFGFPATLPTLAAHAGLCGFSTQKLRRGALLRAARPIPFVFGRWRGADGSEILAALDPGEYGAPVETDLSRDPDWLERLAGLERDGRPPRRMLYTGCGDRGGGLPERSIARLVRSLDSDGPIEVRNGGSEAIFVELEPEQRARLPEYEGELLLRQHGTGCYTSKGALKRWNRANERLARAAETAAVAARAFAGRRAPTLRLERAWWRFLAHQMHDDLTGTSIPAAYDISLADEAIAANEFAEMLLDAVGALARGLDLSGPGRPIVVFNPLGAERTDLVEILLPADVDEPSEGPPWVIDPDGLRVPAQWSTARGERSLLIVARAPAAGCAVFHLLATPAERSVLVRADPETLENERLQARFDAEGRLAGLLDRALGRELLAAPAELERFHDRSRKYPAWEILWSDLAAGPLPERARCVRSEVVEQGPARVALEIERELEGLRTVERWSLAAGAAGDRLECAVTLDAAAPETLLKAAFRSTAAGGGAVFDAGIGAVRRPVASEALYEVPAQQWAAIEDAGRGHGLAVLSDVRSGWDHPEPSTLRLTWLHAPAASHKWRHQRTQDLGRHRFRFALAGFAGEADAAGVAALADRFGHPLLGFVAEPDPVRRADATNRRSLLAVEGGALVQAIKAAEDGDRVVVRLRNPRSAPVEAIVRTPLGARQAEPLDGRERTLGEGGIEARGENAFALRLRGGGLATVGLSLPPPSVGERHPASAPLPLPWGLSAFAARGETGAGRGFDDRGRFFPLELRPESLDDAAVPFDLSHVGRGGGDAVVCRGQSIDLPEAVEEVWLLAASVGGALEAGFELEGETVRIAVPDWRTPLYAESRWSRAGLGPKLLDEIVRRVPVAWVTPFLRDRRGRDLWVEPALLFQVRVATRSARTLRLPALPRLRVVAATASFERARPVREASPLLA